MNNTQLQFIIDCDVEELVKMLIDNEKMDIPMAFQTVYESEIYKKLINTKTGLYIQSPAYIYDYLKNELSSTINIQ